MPITNELDLHGIRPSDVKDVLLEYLIECRKIGILEVRVIHGKGIGEMRRTVQSILAKADGIRRFADANLTHGGWGATMVYLNESKD